jgi:type IV secretion system protein VirB2
MPWETILARLVASLSGPVAQAVGVGSVVIFGLGLALSEGGGLRVILGILLGLSIAFGAATIVAGFFGFTGGATF